MGTYASYTDVSARVAGRTIGTTSKPTSTQVDAWVDEAEALLHGALAAAGVSTPITGTGGIKIMRSWACDYAEGRCRQAWIAAGGGGDDDGEPLITRFNDLIKAIVSDPTTYAAMMLGSTSSDEANRVRGYVIDNDDDLSISDGDFDPTFDVDEEY